MKEQRSQGSHNSLFQIQQRNYKKIVHEGHWAAAGEDIYDIVDMSVLWVMASVPEADIKAIKPGQQADIRAVSYPDELFKAKVNFISPMLNPETRTLEVRLDVTNRNYRLKPDMYVKVEIGSAGYEWNIVIPRNAVIRTGKMDIVYIKKDNNVFSPVKVSIGGEQDGKYLITSGLSEGDEIVTSAGFLIDSESQIQTGNGSQNMEAMDLKTNEEPEFNKDQDVMKDMKKDGGGWWVCGWWSVGGGVCGVCGGVECMECEVWSV
ncbi:MAG: efflux RND transporter periplasmic adaptor subunit [Ignavibacteria bacterium]|nr:efflux RND transporter periplasmic adaptor subunit [Ignavibacteria bacterium]